MVNETTPTHSWRLVTRCLLLKLRPSEKLVLQALAFHYPKPFPSIARIAALAGVSRATAKRALRELVGKGLIFKNWRRNRTTVYGLKVDRILMQAEKREKSLAQNEPQSQFEPGQDDPPADDIIRTVRESKSTDHASKELGNKPEELNGGIEIESHDHPDPASSGDLREDAQSALRPNCASSRLEVGGVQDQADSEEATVTSLPVPSPTSEHEKKDKASSASAPTVSKPPAMPLPANWDVVQEPTGRWVMYEVNADGKSSIPIGFGRTKEAAIADARATEKGAAKIRAKWAAEELQARSPQNPFNEDGNQNRN